MLLLNLMDDAPAFHLDSTTKLKDNAFGPSEREHLVVFREGELLQGVLDKSQIGPTEHGLVHALYEIYGPNMAANVFTAFGRLFTCYLQFAGHTCAMEDLVLTKAAENERSELIDESIVAGLTTAAEFVSDIVLDKISLVDTTNDDSVTPTHRDMLRHKLFTKMITMNDREGFHQAWDACMMSSVHRSNSELIKACLPKGQFKPFPENNFSLMILSGAKGSVVNHAQISCSLGQQALEGRRVPILISGRSLPSFQPFDPTPRAHGFITDRFLTGLRPQVCV